MLVTGTLKCAAYMRLNAFPRGTLARWNAGHWHAEVLAAGRVPCA